MFTLVKMLIMKSTFDVQNSEIRKHFLWILLVKMCWVRKLSKSEYKSNSISTYFKPDCKTNIVPIVCLAVWIGEFIWWQRYPKCANQNPNNGICRWQQQNWLRRLNWKEIEWVSIYGAEVKGPQPASPPYQYYTKKLELAEKQVWKKDSMTNGEAIFPKRPVKTTGFFFFCQAKKNLLYLLTKILTKLCCVSEWYCIRAWK